MSAIKFKLREFKSGDEKSLQKNINDKDMAKNTLLIPYPYTKKDAQDWINRNLKLKRLKNRNEINFVIDINNEVAGSVSFNKIDKNNKNAEIGCWLAKKYWNKGIMTGAVKQMIKYGFKKLKLKRIYAYIFPFNKASQRMTEKAGFQLEGKLRKHVIKNEKFYDDLLYAKIK